jgi:hypothetical protein
MDCEAVSQRLTLARRSCLTWRDWMSGLLEHLGGTVGEVLLEPTRICVMELTRHFARPLVTGWCRSDGFLNLPG